MAEQKHAGDFSVSGLKDYIANKATSTVERLLAEETAEDGGNRTTAVAALEARLAELTGEPENDEPKPSSTPEKDQDPQEAPQPKNTAADVPDSADTEPVPGVTTQSRAQAQLEGETEEQYNARTAKKELSAPPPGGGVRQVDVADPNREKAAREAAVAADDPTHGPWEGTGVAKAASPAPARIPNDMAAPERHVADTRARRTAAPVAPTRFDPQDTRERQKDKG